MSMTLILTDECFLLNRKWLYNIGNIKSSNDFTFIESDIIGLILKRNLYTIGILLKD